MHLLNTRTYKLSLDSDFDPERATKKLGEKLTYAILSHPWETKEPEINFADLHPRYNPSGLKGGNLEKTHPNSYRKIVGACDKAAEQGHRWIWVDTCCIDRDSSADKARAIGSMFDWYSKAEVCYAYLRDVSWSAASTPSPQMFRSQDDPTQNSIWFKRGWTLQELLAAKVVEFYGHDWTRMGTKKSLANVIGGITGIEERYLNDSSSIHEASVATRMSWMAGRRTTELEDIAYSMFGIFGVNMPLVYGEGRMAFMRLQQTIIQSRDRRDESIFAWVTPPQGLKCFGIDRWTPADHQWGLLAPSPDCFVDSRDVIVDKRGPRPGEGYVNTTLGVAFHLTVIPGSEATNWFRPRKMIEMPLHCWKPGRDGKPVAVMLHLKLFGNEFRRIRCNEWLTKAGAKPGTTRWIRENGPLAVLPVTVAQQFVPSHG